MKLPFLETKLECNYCAELTKSQVEIMLVSKFQPAAAKEKRIHFRASSAESIMYACYIYRLSFQSCQLLI